MKTTTRDYHGFTTHKAWLDFESIVVTASRKGVKNIIIITGNGAISREISTWANNNPKVISIKKLNKDNGKWLINIKSQRKPVNKYPKSLIDHYKLMHNHI